MVTHVKRQQTLGIALVEILLFATEKLRIDALHCWFFQL